MKELESLSAFLERTGGFMTDSLPHNGGFQTNDHLPLKVGGNGNMEPFTGNTVVFPLPEHIKQEIGRVQRQLYQNCAPALAQPLNISSFHITLHDLLSGKPTQDLNDRIGHVRNPALHCIKQISADRETVCLHSTTLFNMVGTSMVLGFAPADEDSCLRLMTYYEMLQEVVPLNYPLTPHVTIAYFRPGKITAELVEGLRAVVDSVNRQKKIVTELPVETIEYQLFSDMNHYWRDM